MNEKILGIIFGIILTAVVMAISVVLTLFYIYYFPPEFLKEFCNCPEVSSLFFPSFP